MEGFVELAIQQNNMLQMKNILEWNRENPPKNVGR